MAKDLTRHGAAIQGYQNRERGQTHIYISRGGAGRAEPRLRASTRRNVLQSKGITMKVDADQRRKDLAVIHLAAKELGLDRDIYEDMLFTVARVRSAGALDFAGRQAVIAHLRSRGASRGEHRRSNPEWRWVDTAAPERKAMLKKVIMLAKSGGYGKKYVDGICAHMFGIERLEMMAPDQLHALIAALVFYQRRRAAKAQA